MPKSISKIYRSTSLIILAIIISGLLNICLFVLQTKAASPVMPEPAISFAYDNGDACSAEPMPAPTQTVNRPSAPMPECCLQQNRNYNILVNTANNIAPTFFGLIISPLADLNPENNSTQYTSRLTYPPPEALALASTVIRE